MNYNKEYYQNFLTEFDPTLIIWEWIDWLPVTINLKKIVHLLFAWQSWSWKSVFILQLLFQMLFLTNPKSLQLILIDPLRVSFKDFKKIPNLLCPVANTSQEAKEAIGLMYRVSKERYQFLENIGFENIFDYNEALVKNKIPYKDWDFQKIVWLEEIPDSYIESTKTENYRLGEPMSQVVAFIDEFSALMLDEDFGWKNPADANTQVLKDLIGISNEARKAWIVIILWTQKIDAASVPMKIRGNMKTRICLKVWKTEVSTATLWDTPENKRDWSKLSGYWDGLIYNEDLNATMAIRFQSAFVSHSDMLDLINGIITVYWGNKFEYIAVNDDYAKSSQDLEPLPIPYDSYKDGLPDVIIVKDNVFLQTKYQKLLSQLIREPFNWDDKVIKLRYPSIKDLPVIKQQFMDVWLLSMNSLNSETWEESLWDWTWEEETTKKKKKQEWEEQYLGLNLKLKGLESVLISAWFTKEMRETWDTRFNDIYLNGMMRLCLLHLNKYYNPAASKLSISDYI